MKGAQFKKLRAIMEFLNFFKENDGAKWGKRKNKNSDKLLEVAKLAGIIIILLANPAMPAQVKPQIGFDFSGGTNELRVLSPWFGIRVGLNYYSSLIFRYHYHHFSYNYKVLTQGGELLSKTKKADLNRFSCSFYLGEAKNSGYISSAYIYGSANYKAFIIDTGTEWQFNKAISGLFSGYHIREKSNLWRPEEKVRWINTYALRLGVKLWILKNLAINPNVYFITNSEKVKARSYSAGIIFNPNWWFSITAYYFRYGETAFYVFRGNYFSFGLNFYF